MSRVAGYCATCGDPVYVGDFVIVVHDKLFNSESCVAVWESRDVKWAIEANLDADTQEGYDD